MFFSCPAKIVDKDVIELPCGREFLDHATTARGDVFVSCYYNSHGALHLYRVVEMNRLGEKKIMSEWL